MQVVETLNPIAREHKSVSTLKSQLAELQDELSKARAQVRVLQPKIPARIRRLVSWCKLAGTGNGYLRVLDLFVRFIRICIAEHHSGMTLDIAWCPSV